MSRSFIVRAVFAALALAMAVSVAGCGKRSAPVAPEGKEKEYTYPRQYPR